MVSGNDYKTASEILKSINKAIFDFLWNGQICVISRDTCFLPLYKRGLGLLNPKRQIQALHLKAFAQIRNQECEELWVCLPRFWIGSFLDPATKNGDSSLMITQNHTLTYSHFYDDLVQIIPETSQFTL